MGRIRRFLQRAELDQNEVNICAASHRVQSRPATPSSLHERRKAAVLDYAATTPVDRPWRRP